MRRMVPILAALAMLALPAGASATDVTSNPIVQRDLAVAAQYWGATACAPTVETGELQFSNISAETFRATCTIRIATSFWPNYATGAVVPCVLLVHEYGHLFGYQDVKDPTSIMYVSPNENLVPGCQIWIAEAQKAHENEEAAKRAAALETELATINAAYEAGLAREAAAESHRKHPHPKPHHRKPHHRKHARLAR